MSDDNLLVIDNLSKRYISNKSLLTSKTTYINAVNHVSLDIKKGETLGLVGESGCGKSTLGRAILQLIPKTEGKIYFKGYDVDGLDKEQIRNLRQKMQIIFQDPYSCLNPRMNVLELVKEPLDVFHIGTKKERLNKTKEILEIVGLGEQHLTRYPHEFSGGQRQRIGIARALILHPEFVVCDEPVSALDVSVRASVLNLMRELQKSLGLTYLFISHDLSVVKHISDRVAVMYLGNIVEFTDKDSLYERPLHPYTKALLEAIPLPDPELDKKPMTIEGDLPSPYDPPSGCPFHTRCRYCTEKCRQKKPELKEIFPDHYAACHFQEAYFF